MVYDDFVINIASLENSPCPRTAWWWFHWSCHLLAWCPSGYHQEKYWWKKWDGHTLGEAKNTQILDDLSSLIEGQTMPMNFIQHNSAICHCQDSGGVISWTSPSTSNYHLLLMGLSTTNNKQPRITHCSRRLCLRDLIYYEVENQEIWETYRIFMGKTADRVSVRTSPKSNKTETNARTKPEIVIVRIPGEYNQAYPRKNRIQSLSLFVTTCLDQHVGMLGIHGSFCKLGNLHIYENINVTTYAQ